MKKQTWTAVVLSAVAAYAAHAGPCQSLLVPGYGPSKLNSSVYALTLWDPDGDGPRPPALVAAGRFDGVQGPGGAGTLNRVVMYEGFRPVQLGSGFDDGEVHALAVLPNGDLVAGGTFQSAGGVPVHRIARFDGVQWRPLGGGVGGPGQVAVTSLAVLPGGDLVAGGAFATAGGSPAANIARWDGSVWRPMGEGVSYSVSAPEVAALVVLSGGDLIAGGYFDSAGGVPANGTARWDGSAWHPLGGGVGPVHCMAVLPDGSVVTGGSSYSFDDQHPLDPYTIARWDGAGWTPMAEGIKGYHPAWLPPPPVSTDQAADILSMTVLADGDLVVGGSFVSLPGVSDSNIARFDFAASSWRSMGGSIAGAQEMLLLPSGGLVIGTSYPFDYLWRWSEPTADLTGDGIVDASDYLEFLGLFDAADGRVDLTGDLVVDFADYLEFLNLFDAGC